MMELKSTCKKEAVCVLAPILAVSLPTNGKTMSNNSSNKYKM